MATIKLDSYGNVEQLRLDGTSVVTTADYGITSSELKNTIDACVSKAEFNAHVNPPKPDVDPETKLTLDCNGWTIAATSYENGYKKKTWVVMPDIVDVLVYNDRVVTVKFADKTKEKAILHPDDKFSIEQGISICIAKKLAGGSAIYNKLVEHALKVKQINEIAKAKKQEETARKKEQNRQDNLKRAERNRKKREKEVNNMAAAFKTAIINLMKEVKNNEEA